MNVLQAAMQSAFAKKGIDLPVSSHNPNQPTCPYCDTPAKLVGGEALYPHRQDLFHKKFWLCKPCEAYVGCHAAGKGYGDGTRPLGRLANSALRSAKSAVHEVFDSIWQDGLMSRPQAYAWLAEAMHIPVAECHVGMFSLEQCHRALDICSDYWEST